MIKPVYTPPSPAIVRSHREVRPWIDSTNAAMTVIEHERSAAGIVDVVTVFITGRECPLACTMCDLWAYTNPAPTDEGHIPLQLRKALLNIQNAQWIKLYNASNFFDPLAVPVCDYEAIALLCEPYERVIVENHPRFTNRHIREFAQLVAGQLEIAIGLESTDDGVLSYLNKQLDASFAQRTIETLVADGIDVRCFVLAMPPGLQCRPASMDSTVKAVRDALSWGARHVSIIPVRTHWGPIKELVSQGVYIPATAAELQRLFVRCLAEIGPDHVCTLDLWDWHHVPGQCDTCRPIRSACLHASNLDPIAASQLDELSWPCECE